jgi:hypothetical protein
MAGICKEFSRLIAGVMEEETGVCVEAASCCEGIRGGDNLIGATFFLRREEYLTVDRDCAIKQLTLPRL